MSRPTPSKLKAERRRLGIRSVDTTVIAETGRSVAVRVPNALPPVLAGKPRTVIVQVRGDSAAVDVARELRALADALEGRAE